MRTTRTVPGAFVHSVNGRQVNTVVVVAVVRRTLSSLSKGASFLASFWWWSFSGRIVRCRWWNVRRSSRWNQRIGDVSPFLPAAAIDRQPCRLAPAASVGRLFLPSAVYAPLAGSVIAILRYPNNRFSPLPRNPGRDAPRSTRISRPRNASNGFPPSDGGEHCASGFLFCFLMASRG